MCFFFLWGVMELSVVGVIGVVGGAPIFGESLRITLVSSKYLLFRHLTTCLTIAKPQSGRLVRGKTGRMRIDKI